MRSVMMAKLLNPVRRKKIAPQLQLNQHASKNTHQEILHYHFSHMVESNANSRKQFTQSSHGQEAAKFIKLIEFATHMSFLIMEVSSSHVIFQCGGINA